MGKGNVFEAPLRAVLAETMEQARLAERAATQEVPPAGAGSGTVTSVALTMPAIFSVTGSPVTIAGTLDAALANQSANRVFAGPTGGGAAAPTFRALVAADIPALSYGTGTVTSVALSLPAIFSVSGSPVTGAGTLTGALANQTANYIWAGPTTGAAAAPTFRAMVADDVPNSLITYAKIQNMATARLLGRTTAGSGVVEEISVGAGLTLSAGVLDTAGGAGVTGTGTNTYLTRWTGASTIGDSTLYLSSGKIISATSNSGLKVQRTGADAISDNVADASFGYFATMNVLAVDRDGGGTIVRTAGFSSDSSTQSTFVYGHLTWFTDATYDIGASGANRARDAYLSRSLYAASIKLLGSGSGTATITPPAAAGTPTLTLPTSTGTLALTSDISTSVNAAVSGTSGKLVKFTGTNTVGNSILTESGATLSAAGTFTIVGQSDTNQFIVRGHSTQTSPQILIQSSAAAELTRLYVNAAGAIALGYQAGNALGTAGETVAIGYQAGLATTDNGGVYIGYQAGKAVTANGLTVQTNVAIGSGALQTNTTGYGNVAIGLESMKVYTGKQSIAIGDRTMLKATSGLYNFAFGEEAVYNLVSGHYNEGIGIQALFSATGSGNIGVGAWALYSNVSGSDNVVFGTNGAFHNTGSYNVEIGGNVGYNSLGSNSVMIGYEAGRTSGSATITDSVYIGYRTGYGASAGNNNVGIGSGALPKTVANAVAVGYQAGAVQTGAGFTAVGYQAGVASTSGTNSTLIGSGAGASLTTNGGCVMLGYQAGGSETGANKLYIHNSNSATPLIYGDFSTPSLTFNGTVTHADGYNLAFGTTTGMKLGTATSQKLGVWNATPIVQPTTGVAAATFTANAGTAVNDASTFDGYTLNQVVKALRNIGLLA
jgi:hypothetical protein